MATFQYAKKGGGLGTVEAPDSITALRMLPADADPTSGVMGGLSGTGAPAPGGAPLPGGTPALPPTGGEKSPLLSFASSLDAAVNLARKKRNESSLGMMSQFRGTVAASDFNSILGNLNAASDKTSADLIERATETQTPDASNILTTTNDAGVVTGIDRATGKVLWSTKAGTGNQQDSDGGVGGNGVMIKSGNLVYTRAKYAEDSADLEASRGADGWADPNDYKLLYDEWVAKGGLLNDFIAKFPPALYINPGADETGQTNDWLPPYLRPKSSGRSA